MELGEFLCWLVFVAAESRVHEDRQHNRARPEFDWAFDVFKGQMYTVLISSSPRWRHGF